MRHLRRSCSFHISGVLQASKRSCISIQQVINYLVNYDLRRECAAPMELCGPCLKPRHSFSSFAIMYILCPFRLYLLTYFSTLAPIVLYGFNLWRFLRRCFHSSHSWTKWSRRHRQGHITTLRHRHILSLKCLEYTSIIFETHCFKTKNKLRDWKKYSSTRRRRLGSFWLLRYFRKKPT